jgi:WD40 repeat protein
METDDCLIINTGFSDGLRPLAFSPNGSFIASSDKSEQIVFWDTKTGDRLKLLKIDRPYERMNITGVTGITEAQKASLKALGAIEDDETRKE